MSGGQMQQRNPDTVRILSADLQPRYEPNFAWKSVCAQYKALTGLRGFWPMSSFDENGNAYDLSGQGRTLTNYYVDYGYENLIPYAEFDGSTSCLFRAVEAGLQILGNETYIVPTYRGLTVGGWFYANDLIGTQGLASRWNTCFANGASFSLRLVGNVPRFIVCDCANSEQVDGIAVNAQTWYFLAGRYTPSSELAVFANDVKSTAPTTFATICAAGSVNFLIGGFSPTYYFEGKASLCFLCASALSDTIIYSLYHQSRAMFGIR